MGIPAAATACRNPDAPSEPNAENRRDEPHEHLERTLEKIRQAVRSVVRLAEVQQQYKQSSNRANGVARELRELEKVLARSENRPDYRQTANSRRDVYKRQLHGDGQRMICSFEAFFHSAKSNGPRLSP